MKAGEKAKLIFLDIDGVLCIPDYKAFDCGCMDNLQEILIKTQAKIIVSSSWRDSNIEEMKLNFRDHGMYDHIIGQIQGVTARGYHYVKEGSNFPLIRGNEIKHFLDTHIVYPWHGDPQLDKSYRINNPDGSFKIMKSNKLNKDFTYCILDDDSDMLYDQRNNFVQTDPIKGLSKEDATRAIEMLNKIM